MIELLGAPVATKITESLITRVEALDALGITPKLAIVRLGENAGDTAYERGAVKRMAKVGVEVCVHALPVTTSQLDLEALLAELSSDSSVHGILMMRPLPPAFDEVAAASCVASSKDVDGMTQGSLAKIYAGSGQGYAPCTAEAVLAILEHYSVALEGKHAVVLGRSLVIGKPVAQLLLAQNATVTTCHSRTQNMSSLTQQADILVSCMGRANTVSKDMVKPGACIIDVSTNSDGNGGITGDVCYEDVAQVAGAITPVPRGVGSVTTSILAAHVVESAEGVAQGH